MTKSEEELKAIQEELKWVTVQRNSSRRRLQEGVGILDILVPAGCLVTAGVLGTGIYYLWKADSRKQQVLMRYRVLAQGATIFLACAGLFHYKRTEF